MSAVAEDIRSETSEFVESCSVSNSPTESAPKLRVINGAEKRRINRQVARAVAIEMLAAEACGALRPHQRLLSIDRIEERWAVSIGSGLPCEKWDDSPHTRPTPLDDVTAIIVDQINMNAPKRQRYLLLAWYKSVAQSSLIAEQLEVSRSGLYVEWNAALGYLRHQFLLSKHQDLIDLVLVF